MELIDLAKSLGIADYPEKAEAVYASLGADDGMLYSREYLRQIHEEYGVLAGIYEETMAAADALRKRPELCLWGRLAAACLNSSDPTLKSLPMPPPDGTAAGDLLALLFAFFLAGHLVFGERVLQEMHVTSAALYAPPVFSSTYSGIEEWE